MSAKRGRTVGVEPPDPNKICFKMEPFQMQIRAIVTDLCTKGSPTGPKHATKINVYGPQRAQYLFRKFLKGSRDVPSRSKRVLEQSGSCPKAFWSDPQKWMSGRTPFLCPEQTGHCHITRGGRASGQLISQVSDSVLCACSSLISWKGAYALIVARAATMHWTNICLFCAKF